MEKICNCELQKNICLDQRDVVGRSQYPGMSYEAILIATVSINKRIEGNSDLSIEGLSPLEREAHFIYKNIGGMPSKTVVELVVNE